MFPELTREELAAGLDRVAEEVLEEASVREPPVDALAVAQALGLVVALDDRQEGRARYVRLGDRWAARSRATILLRPEPRFERRQWAVAHEIGEHVAHRVFSHWGTDPRETVVNARELVANALAGRLLLPTAWFATDAAASQWDLFALKARYRTASHELIARRMLECRPAVVISIFDQRRLSFRRSNVSGRVPPPSHAEIECWSSVNESCRPLQTRQGSGLVQGWPVHEEGRQREILRMEIDEWGMDDN
jgi:Zn-dependent peptidase ImmA (M78 family)